MYSFSPLSWKKTEIGFVFLVLALLFGVSFFQLRIGQEKTRDAQRKADLELVGRALDAYLSDHRTLPLASANGEIIACGSQGTKPCTWGDGSIVDSEGVVYLAKMPLEPFANTKHWKYVYTVSENRMNYKLYTALEYSPDPSFKKDLTITCGNNVQCNWYVAN